MNTTGRIFVALDGLGGEAACALVNKIRQSPFVDSVGAFKIHDLWDQIGSRIVKNLKEAGASQVFVDLKLHDTPNTVELRAKAVSDAGADIVTVHASGGIRMMAAAVKSHLKILGITVLTSLTEEEAHLFYGKPAKATVLQLAQMAQMANTWGIVCSAHEVGVLAKSRELGELNFIVPGIRLNGKIDNNQKRIDSPKSAFEAGADHIVVGSEITKAENPIAVLEEIVKQIESVNVKERR